MKVSIAIDSFQRRSESKCNTPVTWYTVNSVGYTKRLYETKLQKRLKTIINIAVNCILCLFCMCLDRYLWRCRLFMFEGNIALESLSVQDINWFKLVWMFLLLKRRSGLGGGGGGWLLLLSRLLLLKLLKVLHWKFFKLVNMS